MRNRRLSTHPQVSAYCSETGGLVKCYVKGGATPGAWYRPQTTDHASNPFRGWPAKHFENVLYALAFSHLPEIPENLVSRLEADVFRIEVQFAHRGISSRDYSRMLERIRTFASKRLSPIEKRGLSEDKNSVFKSLTDIERNLASTPGHKGWEIALFEWHRGLMERNFDVSLPRWLRDICNVNRSNHLSSPTDRSEERFIRIFWSYTKHPDETSRTAFIDRDGTIAHVEATRSDRNILLLPESEKTNSFLRALMDISLTLVA